MFASILNTFSNCFKIPELRQRIIFTLCVVVVVRIGAAIPCPGINTTILARYFHQIIEKDPSNTVVGLFNLFSGGALLQPFVGGLDRQPSSVWRHRIARIDA